LQAGVAIIGFNDHLTKLSTSPIGFVGAATPSNREFSQFGGVLRQVVFIWVMD